MRGTSHCPSQHTGRATMLTLANLHASQMLTKQPGQQHHPHDRGGKLRLRAVKGLAGGCQGARGRGAWEFPAPVLCSDHEHKSPMPGEELAALEGGDFPGRGAEGIAGASDHPGRLRERPAPAPVPGGRQWGHSSAGQRGPLPVLDHAARVQTAPEVRAERGSAVAPLVPLRQSVTSRPRAQRSWDRTSLGSSLPPGMQPHRPLHGRTDRQTSCPSLLCKPDCTDWQPRGLGLSRP